SPFPEQPRLGGIALRTPVRRTRARNEHQLACACRCGLSTERFNANLLRRGGPTRVAEMLSLRGWNRRDAPNTCSGAREAGAQTERRGGAGPVRGLLVGEDLTGRLVSTPEGRHAPRGSVLLRFDFQQLRRFGADAA